MLDMYFAGGGAEFILQIAHAQIMCTSLGKGGGNGGVLHDHLWPPPHMQTYIEESCRNIGAA